MVWRNKVEGCFRSIKANGRQLIKEAGMSERGGFGSGGTAATLACCSLSDYGSGGGLVMKKLWHSRWEAG